MTRGVTRKVMRDIPSCVTQEVLRSKKAYIETRGTAKEEVMEGDPKCTRLVEASIYYNKLVYYTSMVSEELNWVVKEKEC